MNRPFLALAVGVLAASSCTPLDDGRGDPLASDLARLARAEDTRRVSGPDMEALVDGTRDARPRIRAAAVRGIGRLERPELSGHVVPLLADDAPLVRAEAANALAQSHHRVDGTGVIRLLMARADEESHPGVRGVLARSLGRLDVDEEGRRNVERALVEASRGPDGEDAPPEQLLGVALGMASLARNTDGMPGRSFVHRAGELSRYGRLGAADSVAPRIRAYALAALTSSAAVTGGDVDGALRDPNPEVRRRGAAAIATLPEAVRSELIRRSLLNEASPVRLEAVRAIGAGPLDARACDRLRAVVERDAAVAVRLAAVDVLARPCPDPSTQIEQLAGLASLLRPDDRLEWHGPAHAVVSLAAVAPGRARALLPPFAAHEHPFVRMYAARAAARADDRATLGALADDADANVRSEVLAGLADLDPDAARTYALDVLATARDPQFVMNAAGFLAATRGDATGDGSGPADEAGPGATDVMAGSGSDPAAAVAALDALDRMSESGEMTRRDARMALLHAAAVHGRPQFLDRLEPYLRDYDPAVAGRAAELMSRWSGQRYLAAPRASPQASFPTADDLVEADRTLIVLHMARGGEIRIRLHPWLAPTNAHRLLTLARRGELDGLTFHRVAPNFVIQGLSPGANEYAGWGPYTRDEVGLPNQLRGAVGLSTRGRDTGDGQIFVNHVDNIRLDHDYTVLGTVVDGMDVVDEVREGDAVERVELREIP